MPERIRSAWPWDNTRSTEVQAATSDSLNECCPMSSLYGPDQLIVSAPTVFARLRSVSFPEINSIPTVTVNCYSMRSPMQFLWTACAA